MATQLQMPVPSPLRHQVVDILRNAITSCLFEPGGRLTERALCEQLGVSRSTVREGLCQLEAEGLVRITPNRGPVITVLTETEAAEIYAIREMLESEASAAAAMKISAEGLQVLKSQLSKIQVARADDDFSRLQREKTLFYAALYAANGNRQLELLLKQMRARVTLVRGLDVDRAARMDVSVRGAREIYAAIRDRDPAAARKASRAHIARAAALALRAMRKASQLAAPAK